MLLLIMIILMKVYNSGLVFDCALLQRNRIVADVILVVLNYVNVWSSARFAEYTYFADSN